MACLTRNTTPQVLRSDAPSVLTILEVLLHDPLYKWMLSPLAARQRQQEASRSGRHMCRVPGRVFCVFAWVTLSFVSPVAFGVFSENC